jgi:hypothetical protein
VAIEFDRTALLSMLGFESMLHDPSLIGGREQNFARWKTRYVHAYRKVHRAHYEAVADLAAKLDSLRPKAQVLTRMTGMSVHKMRLGSKWQRAEIFRVQGILRPW